MLDGVLTLNTFAAACYLVVAAAALAAARAAHAQDRVAASCLHWLLIAGLFVLLAISRLCGIEDGLQGALRLALQDEGIYERRRDFQRPLAAIVVLIGLAALIGLVHRLRQGGTGPRNLAIGVASLAAAAMIGLVALRIVSLHVIDALLYGAPKLNWLIDMGSSLAVLGAAVFYCRRVRQRG